jgi:hypothetical protein
MLLLAGQATFATLRHWGRKALLTIDLFMTHLGRSCSFMLGEE